MGLPRERKHCVFKVLGHARVGDAEGTIVAKVAGHPNVTHTANDGTLQHSFQTKAMSGCTICAVTLPKGTCVGMRWQRCRKSNEIKLAPNCCARDDDGGYFSFPRTIPPYRFFSTVRLPAPLEMSLGRLQGQLEREGGPESLAVAMGR